MEYTKILFEIYEEDSEEVEIESLWAIQKGDTYVIDNIPFFAKNFALGDTVKAKLVNNELYVYELIEASGNSTLRIWFSDQKMVDETRKSLKKMGCSSELSHLSRLIAVNVPSEVNYEIIKDFLDKGEGLGKWEYEEACLGF